MADFNVSVNISAVADELKKTFSDAGKEVRNFSKVVTTEENKVSSSMKEIGIATAGAVASFRAFPQLLRAVGSDLRTLGGFAKKASGDFIGLSKNLFLISGGLGIVGSSLKNSENQVSRSVGAISASLSAAALGVSAGITAAIAGFGVLTDLLGTKIVNSVNSALDSFAKFEKQALIFERTVEGFNREFGDSTGNLDFWANRIEEAARATGESRGNLQAVTAELVAAGSQFGLTSSELSTLLDVILDYSTITGDSFQTTIDFIGALQGNSQAVVKYGIKLSEASLEQKLLKEGIDRSFRSLSEQEKQQLRLNKILSVYPAIAGKAAAVNETLAGQQRRLSNNLTDIAAKFGAGAAVIENLNVQALATNVVLESVNDGLFKAAGFVAALSGRVLQLIGTLLKWSAVIITVKKAIDLLNLSLQSNTIEVLATKTIPFLNRSLSQLAPQFVAAASSIRSSNQLFALFGATIRNTIISGLQLARLAVLNFSRALLALLANPITLAIAAIGTAIFGVVKALEFINDRTGVFTTTWNILKDTIATSSTVFQPIADFFGFLAQRIATAGRIVAGFFIDKFAGSIKFVTDLLKSNPFNIFSAEQVARFDEVSQKLGKLRDDIQGVGFDIGKLPPIEVDVKAPSQEKVKQTVDQIIKQLTEEVNRGFAEASAALTTARFEGASDSAIRALRTELQDGLRPQVESARQALLELYNETGNLDALKAAEDLGNQLLSLDNSVKRVKDSSEELNTTYKDTAKEAQSAFDGIDRALSSGLSNAFTEIANGSEEAGDAFENFASRFLDQIAQMILQSLILQSIQGAIGANFGGSEVSRGAPIQTPASSFNPGAIAASGGLVEAGQIIKRFAEGGMVSGPGSGTSDSVPALLSNGEFVSDRKTTDFFGANFFSSLKKIARGGMPNLLPSFAGASRFADGGFVGSGSSDRIDASQSSTGSMNIEIINNSSSDAQVAEVNQIETLKGMVTQIILEDNRKNGPIAKSNSQTFNTKRRPRK